VLGAFLLSWLTSFSQRAFPFFQQSCPSPHEPVPPPRVSFLIAAGERGGAHEQHDVPGQSRRGLPGGPPLRVCWLPSKGMEHVAAGDLFRDGVDFGHQPTEADQWRETSGKRKLKAREVRYCTLKKAAAAAFCLQIQAESQNCASSSRFLCPGAVLDCTCPPPFAIQDNQPVSMMQ